MGTFGKGVRKFIDDTFGGHKQNTPAGTGAAVLGKKPAMVYGNPRAVNDLMREADAELNSQSVHANRPKK